MRVKSLLILVVLAAAAAYVYFFQWEWVGAVTEDVRLNLSGYTAAKTPEDAMDRFVKAIKAREYAAAARYCTKDYADNLNRGRKAAYEIGWRVDRLIVLMDDKDLKSDRALLVLYSLDPFPSRFQRSTDKGINEVKKGEPKMEGWFKSDLVSLTSDGKSIHGLDPKMFRKNLMPPGDPLLGQYYRVILAPEGEGDARTWKLDIPLDPDTRERTDYLVQHYKGYTLTLDNLIDLIHRNPYDSKSSFADELVSQLAKRNEK